MTESHPAQSVLERLGHLLDEERAALIRLDRDAIERLAADKLKLDEELREVVASCSLIPSQKPLVESIRNRALDNQLLLSHARSCVQGVLSLLAPSNSPGYRAGSRVTSTPPLALNLRR